MAYLSYLPNGNVGFLPVFATPASSVYLDVTGGSILLVLSSEVNKNTTLHHLVSRLPHSHLVFLNRFFPNQRVAVIAYITEGKPAVLTALSNVNAESVIRYEQGSFRMSNPRGLRKYLLENYLPKAPQAVLEGQTSIMANMDGGIIPFNFS